MVNCGPQNNVTAKRVCNAMSTALRSAGLQDDSGPSGVAAQSTRDHADRTSALVVGTAGPYVPVVTRPTGPAGPAGPVAVGPVTRSAGLGLVAAGDQLRRLDVAA